MGKIYERKTVCGTPQFTLDYTKEHTYYLSIVAYGDYDTQEFNTENDLECWLKEQWYFSDKDIEELKDCMYSYND